MKLKYFLLPLVAALMVGCSDEPENAVKIDDDLIKNALARWFCVNIRYDLGSILCKKTLWPVLNGRFGMIRS